MSPDPLTPPAGALWVNNPYDYANNNPLTLTDPLGTHPVTDDQLAGLTHPVRHWWATHKDHILSWQFGLGVLAVGIGLTATGFGAGAGIGLITAATSGALISGGSTLAIEKYSTGDVNWANVGKQAAIGFITGAVTAGTSNFLDSQLLKFPGKTAEKAMTEFGNITKINKAGTGIWSQLNGASKAQRAFKMAVDHGWEDAIKENIGNEFLGDIVVQPIASGAEYISDSVINHKKFSMTDLMLANVDGEFTAILPGGIRTACTRQRAHAKRNILYDSSSASPVRPTPGRDYPRGSLVDSEQRDQERVVELDEARQHVDPRHHHSGWCRDDRGIHSRRLRRTCRGLDLPPPTPKESMT